MRPARHRTGLAASACQGSCRHHRNRHHLSRQSSRRHRSSSRHLLSQSSWMLRYWRRRCRVSSGWRPHCSATWTATTRTSLLKLTVMHRHHQSSPLHLHRGFRHQHPRSRCHRPRGCGLPAAQTFYCLACRSSRRPPATPPARARLLAMQCALAAADCSRSRWWEAAVTRKQRKLRRRPRRRLGRLGQPSKRK